MSITAETAQAHAKDPAVLCCRAEAVLQSNQRTGYFLMNWLIQVC